MNLGEKEERNERQYTQVKKREILFGGDVVILVLSIPQDSYDPDLFLINNRDEIRVIIRDEIRRMTRLEFMLRCE